MKNYKKTNVGNENRTELHEKLSITGAEISINQLSAGTNVPFVHSHKNNEEIYDIISGCGKAVIDNEEIEFSTGDWLKRQQQKDSFLPQMTPKSLMSAYR